MKSRHPWFFLKFIPTFVPQLLLQTSLIHYNILTISFSSGQLLLYLGDGEWWRQGWLWFSGWKNQFAQRLFGRLYTQCHLIDDFGDVVKTSLLSYTWWFCWTRTRVTKLYFDSGFLDKYAKPTGLDAVSIVDSILSRHHGPSWSLVSVCGYLRTKE